MTFFVQVLFEIRAEICKPPELFGPSFKTGKTYTDWSTPVILALHKKGSKTGVSDTPVCYNGSNRQMSYQKLFLHNILFSGKQYDFIARDSIML